MPKTVETGVGILTSAPIWSGAAAGPPAPDASSSSMMTCAPETVMTRPSLTSSLTCAPSITITPQKPYPAAAMRRAGAASRSEA